MKVEIETPFPMEQLLIDSPYFWGGVLVFWLLFMFVTSRFYNRYLDRLYLRERKLSRDRSASSDGTSSNYRNTL